MTHSLTRPALILLAGSAIGACATPNFPIEAQAAPAPAPAPVAAQPAPPPVRETPAPEIPRPTAPVESRPLELPPAAAATPAPQVEAPAPAPAYVPPPPPKPTYRTVTTRSVTGKVVEVEGPRVTYEVKKGDNLEKIAKKLDTEVEQLAKDNKLKKPYVIQPGDELKGPKTTAKAYTVGQGDTLSGVSRRFGVSVDALRDENDLKKNAALKPGQKLRLPSGFKDKGPAVTTTRVLVEPPVQQAAAPPPVVRPPPPATTQAPPPPQQQAAAPAAPPVQRPTPAPTPVQPAAPRPQAQLPVTPRPYAPPPTAQTTQRPYTPPPAQSTPRPYTPPPSASNPSTITGAPVASPPPSDTMISTMGRGRFVWPIRGELLSGFGPKGAGQRNDGVNIRGAAGEPVRAAAAGDVVYAGDQVPGFGNLVLIKHADGWVTAYGHLARVEVRMQQKVTQGQQIGLVGTSGGVTEPQLHFEVRYAPTAQERARPINPDLVLPR